MAGKKSIKQLRVDVTTTGAQAANKEIQALDKSINTASRAVGNMNSQLGTAKKHLDNMTYTYKVLDKSLESSSKSIMNFSKTINTGTKAGAQRIKNFAEDIEILTLYMDDLANSSDRVAKSFGKMQSPTTDMGRFNEILEEVLTNLQDMSMNIESVDTRLGVLNSQTDETIHTLDRLADRITDVEVQTKKGRIQTEALGSTFKESGAKAKTTGKQYERVAKSAELATNATRRLNAAGSSSARGFSDLAFRMNPLVSLYATVAVNVYALSEAFRLLTEASNLNRLREQTGQFAATLSGIDIQGLASDLQELSGNAINAGDALRQSVRGVSYGFAADDMERLTVGARKASVALGGTFADAMDRAFRGIAKGEVEVLDEIGVVTRLDTAYRKYAVQLDKTADELSEVERRTALTVEVISQLESRFSSFDVDATGIERFGVAMKDLVDNSLMGASKALDNSARMAANFVKGFSGVETQLTRVEQAQEVYNNAIEQGNEAQATIAYRQLQQSLEAYGRELTSGTEENKKYLASLEGAQRAQKILNMAMGAGIIVLGAYAAILTTKAILATIGFTTAMLGHIATAVTFVGVTVLSTIKTLAFHSAMFLTFGFMNYSKAIIGSTTAVLGVYTMGAKAAAAATLAFAKRIALLLIPIGLVLLKLALIVGAISLVAYSIGWLIDKFTGGKFFAAIADFFGWIGDKLSYFGGKIKEFFSFLGFGAMDFAQDGLSSLGGALEGITDSLGLSDLTAGLTGAAGATEEARMSVEEYRRSLETLSSNPNAMAYLMGPKMSPEGAEEVLKYITLAQTGFGDLAEKVQALQPPKSAFEDFAQIASSLSDLPVELRLDKKKYEEIETRFDRLKDDGVIPATVTFDGGEGFRRWGEEVDALAKKVKWFAEDAGHELSVLSSSLKLAGDEDESLKVMKAELTQIVSQIEAYKVVGKAVSGEAVKELERKQELLKLEIDRTTNANKFRDYQRDVAVSNETAISALQLTTTWESEILELKIRQAEATLMTAEKTGQQTAELKQQLESLRAQLGITTQVEAKQLKGLELTKQQLSLEAQSAVAGNNVSKLEFQTQLLEIEQKRVDLMAEGIEKMKAQAALDQQVAANKQAQAPGAMGLNSANFADIGESASAISSIEGLTELQSTFSSTFGDISNTYSDFLSQMKTGSGSFMEYLSSNTEALANTVQAGVGLAQQAMASMSQAKIAGIDREIEAEKKRDGKSAESKKKIKQLEAKRIKEEAKAKKASIVMSTAMAVMQAFAQMGPLGAPFAAIMAAMGAMQLAQVSKAESGQLAGLSDGGGGSLSISGGQRSKDIDLVNKANAGELAYLRGEQGTGSSSNFTPGRAGGNSVPVGTRITLGESGPEEFVTSVPGKVTPAGKTSDSAPIIFSPQYTLSAVDAMGMEELMQRHSRSLYEGLEQELNARNKSLNDL